MLRYVTEIDLKELTKIFSCVIIRMLIDKTKGTEPWQIQKF